MAGLIGPVPTGCRHRIAAVYGAAAEAWLEEVPGRLGIVADRWGLVLDGYYDAGHASVIARAHWADGAQGLLKAWFDDRYDREVAALRLWHDRPAVHLTVCADDLKIALMGLIGGCPGGAPRPTNDAPAVAEAIASLHTAQFSQTYHPLPLLADYRDGEVLPRIRRRISAVGDLAPADCVRDGSAACDALARIGGPPVLLHADLYRENVLWDEAGQPVVIDPLPMVGDAAFDWAFWTVYYNLANGHLQRLHLSGLHSSVELESVLTWSTALALDGLLFYLETSDPRSTRMVDVLRDLARHRLTAVQT
jgi:streptomycin 6-kinase